MFAFMAVYHLLSLGASELLERWQRDGKSLRYRYISLGIALRIGFSSIPNNSSVIFKRQRYKKTVSDTFPAIMFVLAFFLEANLFPPGKNSVFI
jgi:hypothetical protein